MSVPSEEPRRNASRAGRPSSWSAGPERRNAGIGRSRVPSRQPSEQNIGDIPVNNEYPPEPLLDDDDGDITARVGTGWNSTVLQENRAGPSQEPVNGPEPGDDSQWVPRSRYHPAAGIRIPTRPASIIISREGSPEWLLELPGLPESSAGSPARIPSPVIILHDLDGSIIPPEREIPLENPQPRRPIQEILREIDEHRIVIPPLSRRANQRFPSGPRRRRSPTISREPSVGPGSPSIGERLNFLQRQLETEIRTQGAPGREARDNVRELTEIVEAWQIEYNRNMARMEQNNSTNISGLQRQNADLIARIGELSRTSADIPKEITRIHGVTHYHTGQLEQVLERLERIETNQRETQTTLTALIEMVQEVDEKMTQHEESEHHTERAPSRANSHGSETFDFDPPRGSTAKPEKVRDGPKEAKLKQPALYEGKRGTEAEDFITRMEVYFMDYDDYFTDEKKVKATLNNTAKTSSHLGTILPPENPKKRAARTP